MSEQSLIRRETKAKNSEAEPTCIKDKHTSYRQNGFLDAFTLFVGEFGILENREPKISKKRFSL